jgi:hypothetical protein
MQMKYFCESIAAVMLGTLLSSNSFAVEPAKQVTEKQQPMKQGAMKKDMGKGMGMGSMSGMSEEKMDQRMRMMQEEMLKMHELSHRILEAKDPKERERLKEEHLALMKAHHQRMMSRMKMMQKHRQQMKQGTPAEKTK